MRDRYETRRRILVGLTLSFTVVGLALAVLGPTRLLASWSDLAAQTFLGGHVSPGLLGLRDLTAMGFWGREEDTGWIARAFLSSILIWFFIDTATCLIRGGLFNVLIVNVPCLLAAVLVWRVSGRR